MAKRDFYIDDEDDDVARDGETVHTPWFLVDKVRFQNNRPLDKLSDWDTADLSRHRPGYRLSDGEARKSDKLSNLNATRDARAAVTASYHAMCDRLRAAWRTVPSRDAAEPDNSSSPELMRRHLRTEEDNGAQARRDRAWARYRDSLQNAWKADPQCAGRIERQGEQWRGGR
jgi:hypothetical protein